MKRCALVAVSLALLSSTAFAYNVRTTGGGTPLRWSAGTVTVELGLSDGPEYLAVDDANAAALSALSTYSDLLASMSPDVTLSIVVTDETLKEKNDGKNVVHWVSQDWSEFYDPGALAVTLTSYDSSTGRITDADIVINASEYAWTASSDMVSCLNAYDLQNVLTHEVGHLFGLGHETADTDATMYPSSGMCESKKRDLDADDDAGLARLYVETAAPSTKDGVASLGCSVGGQGNGALGMILVASAIFLGNRRRRALGLLAAAALSVVGAAPASATTVRHLSLDEMSADAVIVVRGVIGGVGAQRIAGHIYTDASVAVSECLKGSCGSALTVRQLGGELEGFGVRVEGTAELRPGTEVVLMLRRRLDGAFSPLGMAQGAFRVEREAKAGAIMALVHDSSSLRLASADGNATVAGIERVTLDDVRASIARSTRR